MSKPTPQENLGYVESELFQSIEDARAYNREGNLKYTKRCLNKAIKWLRDVEFYKKQIEFHTLHGKSKEK
jgi:hypothetical protein